MDNFDNFYAKKTKKFDKEKEFAPLSDDIVTLAKLDNLSLIHI